MSHPHPDSEEALELQTIELFASLGYNTANCYGEWESGTSTLGRENKSEVILRSRLQFALAQLNPDLEPEALTNAIDILTIARSALSTVNANREIYKLLKEGIKVSYRDRDNEAIEETVKIIDWQNPENNDFFLASQFWIAGETYTRRTDLLGFVNGIPLVFIELKAHKEPIEKAYDDNFTDYKTTIPQLFRYNGLVLLSNGSRARIGSITSPWKYFYNWKKINEAGDKGRIPLETLILGTCEKTNLLDIIENFILYEEKDGSVKKIIAQNHQYLGVNAAIANVREVYQNSEQGKKRLGVFWHTQGSGKSFSMQFFAEKVCRKLSGNWKILVITDRDDLDDQIYKNFARTGAVTEPEKTVRATSAEHLKQLLREDHRYIFTLIQKFRAAKGEIYPKLSDDPNIIVMADEAHRSQYDTYSVNLRSALPNAAFIGFTGTPLIVAKENAEGALEVGEQATLDEFGDYVSIYNFRESIEDGATVPLFYENRIPELQLTNSELNEDITNAIDVALLDEDQEEKLAREFSREYQLITREDRLETIARDIVTHFLDRGYQGKAMVVSIDRFTTVKIYDKVQYYWQQEIAELKALLGRAIGAERDRLSAKIQYLEETDMAVILSSGHNEEEKFQQKGLTILPHRERLTKEKPSLDEKFKNPDHPLRIVFVCAMWMTGFDVPNCSTIYLDKPMKNHTLMQTIARANRVYEDKVNGLIVDYIGIFNNLQDALKIYGASSGNGVARDDSPIKAKSELVGILAGKVNEFKQYLAERNIDLDGIARASDTFERIRVWDEAVDSILVNLDSKQKFLESSRVLVQIYKAILPDVRANEFTALINTVKILRQKILNLDPRVNIDEIKGEIESVLDDSIAAYRYAIPESRELIDISELDFDAIERKFAEGYRNTLLERLQNSIDNKLDIMVKLNKSRINYYERFQKMIDEYNSRSRNQEIFFNQLLEFTRELNREDNRAIAENLDEEKLALFDLLLDPEIQLSEKDKKAIKKAAEELLSVLKREKLVLDWRKRQQTRAPRRQRARL
jgi:type I restriction enzyme R subunit